MQLLERICKDSKNNVHSAYHLHLFQKTWVLSPDPGPGESQSPCPLPLLPSLPSHPPRERFFLNKCKLLNARGIVPSSSSYPDSTEHRDKPAALVETAPPSVCLRRRIRHKQKPLSPRIWSHTSLLPILVFIPMPTVSRAWRQLTFIEHPLCASLC